MSVPQIDYETYLSLHYPNHTFPDSLAIHILYPPTPYVLTFPYEDVNTFYLCIPLKESRNTFLCAHIPFEDYATGDIAEHRNVFLTHSVFLVQDDVWKPISDITPYLHDLPEDLP